MTYKFADSRKLYFEFEQKKCVSNFSFTLSFKMTAELIKGCFVINFRSYEYYSHMHIIIGRLGNWQLAPSRGTTSWVANSWRWF